MKHVPAGVSKQFCAYDPSYIVAEYEAASIRKDATAATKHHEQGLSAQKSFLDALHRVLQACGNPFLEDSSDLMVLDTKDIADPANATMKSELLHILESGIAKPDVEPKADTIIIDGSAFINANPPRGSKTFRYYAAEDILPKIQAYCSKYKRVDIVFDVYKKSSLKSETRAQRGKAIRRRVRVFTGTCLEIMSGSFKRRVVLEIIVLPLLTMVTCKETRAVIIALHKKGFRGQDIAAGFRASKKVQQAPGPSPKVDLAAGSGHH
ncbi:unnamed protein product [Pleuronectes platessa]|uniref:Uncharacterized protein n=1 Tax=Pleuronectes platessa TaxID=8262 RepID=A0A9N7VBT0_PLEPL|nr:unnamed protein product [Pleuronectes platessa]